MSALARTGNVLAVGSVLLLLTLILSRTAWLLPPPDALVAPLLIMLTLPLLLPLRGLLHGRRYTHSWTSLLSVIYFVHGVAAAGTAGLSRTLGILEIVLSLGLFTGCVLFARFTRA